MYSRRLPSDLQDIERDVFNEKPSKEDIISVTEGQGKMSSQIISSGVTASQLVLYVHYKFRLFICIYISSSIFPKYQILNSLTFSFNANE